MIDQGFTARLPKQSDQKLDICLTCNEVIIPPNSLVGTLTSWCRCPKVCLPASLFKAKS